MNLSKRVLSNSVMWVTIIWIKNSNLSMCFLYLSLVSYKDIFTKYIAYNIDSLKKNFHINIFYYFCVKIYVIAKIIFALYDSLRKRLWNWSKTNTKTSILQRDYIKKSRINLLNQSFYFKQFTQEIAVVEKTVVFNWSKKPSSIEASTPVCRAIDRKFNSLLGKVLSTFHPSGVHKMSLKLFGELNTESFVLYSVQIGYFRYLIPPFFEVVSSQNWLLVHLKRTNLK